MYGRRSRIRQVVDVRLSNVLSHSTWLMMSLLASNALSLAVSAVLDTADRTTASTSRRGFCRMPSAYFSALVPIICRTISGVVRPSSTPDRTASRIDAARSVSMPAIHSLSSLPWNGLASAMART
ncbi:hypothetical protein D3C80_1704650 [compost metagenome]